MSEQQPTFWERIFKVEQVDTSLKPDGTRCKRRRSKVKKLETTVMIPSIKVRRLPLKPEDIRFPYKD